MPTGVFLGAFPDARFVFTRSYVHTLSFLGDSVDYDNAGDTFTMWIDRPTGYGVTYVLKPFIQPWSSNHYTLDHVVDDCWWHYGFDGIHHNQAYTVNYWWVGSPSRPHLTIVQPLAGTMRKDYVLPPAPPTYWLPPNL